MQWSSAFLSNCFELAFWHFGIGHLSIHSPASQFPAANNLDLAIARCATPFFERAFFATIFNFIFQPNDSCCIVLGFPSHYHLAFHTLEQKTSRSWKLCCIWTRIVLVWREGHAIENTKSGALHCWAGIELVDRTVAEIWIIGIGVGQPERHASILSVTIIISLVTANMASV